MKQKVTDATRTIAFRITPADIKRARKKDSAHCAAAIAIKRQLGATKVDVHTSRTYVEIGGRQRRFETPPALRTEIVALDRGGSFEPGDYELRPIPPSQTVHRLASTNKRNHQRKKSTPIHKRRQLPNVRMRGRGRA